MAWIAVADLVFGALFLGSPGLGVLVHVLGGISAIAGAKSWTEYWASRDRYELWKRRHGR